MNGEGVVYFIQAAEGGPIKIGVSGSEAGVARRLSALQVGNPSHLVVRRVVHGGWELERELHDRFAVHRVEGEWFIPVPEIAKLAHAPDLARGDKLRHLVPYVERAFEVGTNVGYAEGERAVRDRMRRLVDDEFGPEAEDDNRAMEQRWRGRFDATLREVA